MFSRSLNLHRLVSFARFSTNLSFEVQRESLVEILRTSGINETKILNAINSVPRHEFVLPELIHLAYANMPMPIGHGQTISQPWIVAEMARVAELKETDNVLEIGSGCGYNAAVLSKLVSKVYSTEIIPELHQMSKDNIAKVGINNVELILSDGGYGLSEVAPFDAIICTASVPNDVPKALLDQLAVNGCMIVPIKASSFHERLFKIVKTVEGKYEYEHLHDVRFVPLTGKSANTTTDK